MKENLARGEAVKHNDNEELVELVIYYTVKGKQDAFDDNGNPVQYQENHLTYAKESGRRKQIRIDDRGRIFNPVGLYANNVKMDRWVPANEEAFSHYLKFLKTKNQMFIRHAERSLT